MTENELTELINDKVFKGFQLNKDIVQKELAELGRKYYPSAIEGLAELQGALLEYTMIVSSIVCVAMCNILVDAGVLNIRPDEK